MWTILEVGNRTLEIIRHTRFTQITHSVENVFVSSSGEIFLLTGIDGVIYYFSNFKASPVQLKNRYTANLFQLIELEGRIIGGNSTGFVVFNGTGFEQLEETDCCIWSLSREDDRSGLTDCGIGLVREGRLTRWSFLLLTGKWWSNRSSQQGTGTISGSAPIRIHLF
jgi:hypothetical protein